MEFEIEKDLGAGGSDAANDFGPGDGVKLQPDLINGNRSGEKRDEVERRILAGNVESDYQAVAKVNR